LEVISNLNGLSNDVNMGDFTIPKSLSNHHEIISFLIERSEFVSITSPFIMQEYEDYFSSINIKNVRFELITSCAPKGNEQLTKPFQIKNFVSVIKEKTNNFPDVHLNQKLHSKIYIFYKNNKTFCAIVTSANFTHSGLSQNHETGMLTINQEVIKTLEYEIKSSLQFVSLSEYQIEMMCNTVESMTRNTRGLERQEDIDIGLTSIIANYCTPSAGNRDIQLREGAEFFISVAGVSDRPILPANKQKFNNPHSTLWFAKEPKSMRLGDCLLEVAVGGQCFLSYYAVASQVFERTEKEKKENNDFARWPYYVYANNLSLNYGESWYENPLYYDGVIENFKSKYPGSYVTTSGGDSIKGPISFGSSYFKITNEFGYYVKGILDQYSAYETLNVN
jgi:hypothetical protein